MRAQADDYPDHIEAALTGLLADGLEAGAKALAPISYPPQTLPPRKSVSRALAVAILKRDHFICRYCNGQTILTPVMELLGGLYPDVFPFESSAWKAGVTHPAVISRSPAVDHVVPTAYGGDNSKDNLVTACTPCNSIKADFTLEQLGWELQPISGTEWDGLTRFYVPLWEMAGKPREKYHVSWIRALGL